MNRLALLCILALLVTGSSMQPADAQTAPSNATAYDDSGHGNYPRVTQLEQDLLGQTYVNDPLPTRVGRLEMKQFGKVSTADLCDRLDKLDEIVKPQSLAPKGYVSDEVDVAPTQTAASGAPGDGSNSQSSGQNSGQSSDIGSYPRVTELERQFLGTTYAGEPLVDRLNRLETKKFNKTFADDALCDRIDRLDKGAQKTGALAEDKALDDSSGSGANGQKKSFGSMLGKALLGLAGVGGIGGGPGGMGMGGMGMSMGRGGLGMGAGPGGMGMGGVGVGGLPGGMGGLGYGGGAGGGRRNPSAQNPPQDVAAANQNPFAPGAEEIRGTESRTAVLEKFVFGKEFIQKPIEQRVAMLEKRLVPYEHNNASKQLGSRVDHLWSILSAANSQPTKKTGVDQ